MDEVVSRFRRFDSNGDGTISRAEFSKLFQTLGAPDGMICDIVKALDLDANQEISYNDFFQWLGDSEVNDQGLIEPEGDVPGAGRIEPEVEKAVVAPAPALPAAAAAQEATRTAAKVPVPALLGIPGLKPTSVAATPRTGRPGNSLPLAVQLLLQGAESKLVARDVKGAVCDIEGAFSDHAEVRSNCWAVELRREIAAAAEERECEYRRGMTRTSPFADVRAEWGQARQRMAAMPQSDRALVEGALGEAWLRMPWEQRWAAARAELPGLKRDRERRLMTPRAPSAVAS
mmetsp:Transcript_51824/g.116729  ORF Transcript_51824/g.116729 Transcript_51824/m.116729 type:complete len:288 (-) Transcript_51824:73-936(-)